MKFYAAVCTALMLAGCSTTTPEQRVADHQSSCASYGFRPGTEGYANCMMRMDMAAKAEDRDRRRRIGAGLQAMGQAMQPPPRVTCNTFGSARSTGYSTFGNSTTTCY